MGDNRLKTEYPILYKVDSKGKIRQWEIWVDHYDSQSVINVKHGQKDGKFQIKSTYIKEGKNIGKKNETSHMSQAKKEAQSTWTKQLDNQYTENIEEQIKNGKDFRPMLAHKFSEQGTKIILPAYVSQKKDGIRCSIRLENNQIVSRSRKGKQFKVLDHIEKSLFNFFSSYSSIVLDGELYIHGESFQLIVGAIKRDEPNELTNQIEFHIYDCFDEDNPDWLFEDRLEFIRTLDYDNVKIVDSFKVKTEEEIYKYKDEFIKDGYEGLMIRNNSPYEQKRSYNLQKVKDFIDDEFLIIDFKIDKNQETVFVCQSEKGCFDVKPKGTHEYRKSLADKKYIGKMLTVEYFGFTDKGLPRFPIGKDIRDMDY